MYTHGMPYVLFATGTTKLRFTDKPMFLNPGAPSNDLGTPAYLVEYEYVLVVCCSALFVPESLRPRHVSGGNASPLPPHTVVGFQCQVSPFVLVPELLLSSSAEWLSFWIISVVWRYCLSARMI